MFYLLVTIFEGDFPMAQVQDLRGRTRNGEAKRCPPVPMAKLRELIILHFRSHPNKVYGLLHRRLDDLPPETIERMPVERSVLGKIRNVAHNLDRSLQVPPTIGGIARLMNWKAGKQTKDMAHELACRCHSSLTGTQVADVLEGKKIAH